MLRAGRLLLLPLLLFKLSTGRSCDDDSDTEKEPAQSGSPPPYRGLPFGLPVDEEDEDELPLLFFCWRRDPLRRSGAPCE